MSEPSLSRDVLEVVPDWAHALYLDFFELKERVAALEKAYASWLPDWAAAQERIAALESIMDKQAQKIAELDRYLEEFDAEQRGLGP